MLHGSERGPVTKQNQLALKRAEMRMDRWICVFKVEKKQFQVQLREKLRLNDIIMELQKNRLQSYGPLVRKQNNDWVNKCMEYEVEVDQAVDQRRLEQRLCKKTVRHVK